MRVLSVRYKDESEPQEMGNWESQYVNRHLTEMWLHAMADTEMRCLEKHKGGIISSDSRGGE